MDVLSKLGFTPIRWDDGAVVILDQRLLPGKEEYVVLKSVEEVAEAIANLSVRGAPLIGIAAAYGLCLGRSVGVDRLRDGRAFAQACALLKSARPTAVNLFWAVDRMAAKRDENAGNQRLEEILVDEARKIHLEDAMMCARVGENGNSIVPDPCRILTHCNAGALATGGIGTALGIIYTAHFSGKKVEVWVDETRPVLQGARLTAWELSKAGVPYKLITDNMAGYLMSRGEIDLVITGADRIAKNMDFANKIGTYSLAVLARYHMVPFYIAAPSSSFDPDCPEGNSITIEMRPESEIRKIGDTVIAPADCRAYNPAFDITPHELVTGVISERGVFRPEARAARDDAGGGANDAG